MTYQIYRMADGFFTGATIACSANFLDMNVPDGHSVLLGSYDPLSQKVDPETGLIIDYQPPQPSPNHIWNTDTRRWDYVPTLADHQATRIADINRQCGVLLARVCLGYPVDEIQSWPKQESEARAYIENPSAPIPLLSSLAAARDIAVPDLVNRVIAKADAFAVISGQLIGKRQRYEDRIHAATTIAAVEAVVWEE